MSNKKSNTRQPVIELLAVTMNPNTGNYSVKIAQGSSVDEAAFCVNVLIRCLTRDKVIDTPDIFIDKVKSYLNDVQYNELKN